MTHIPACPVGPDWQSLCDRIAPVLRQLLKAETQLASDIMSKDSEVAGDLVTAADLRIQARLHELLLKLLPGSRFIGEEDFAAIDRLEEAFFWIVDPLDGTLNFASGLPFFGASVALVHAGHPVLGLVLDCGSDSLFDASHDGPARCNGQAFTWDAGLAARSPVGISSGFMAQMRRDPARFDPAWLGQRFRIFGSQAIQLCWAAEGRLRLNINHEAKLWDDAAGALICQRAGAAHEALASAPFFPLVAGSKALAGQSLFSVSGSPELVARCIADFRTE
ncbi:MAG: inositol monophosphatase family protein [Gemmobacter sp.]|uniref:inositol monophosphatase family protein n=1 Tax=Gemmobacter sp. TaxID=1898957 RepID=UPI001A59FB6C|nr:inositol monophosphatase family protein [Gemmobacter sp.]MBL8562996.1 inositol monophosphatase family protein [Gemmobacter sp.]